MFLLPQDAFSLHAFEINWRVCFWIDITVPMSMLILINPKPLPLELNSHCQSSIYVQGIQRGGLSNVANLTYKLPSSNEILRKHMINALHNSNGNSDSESSVSGHTNKNISQKKTTKLKKTKDSKGYPSIETFECVPKPLDDNVTSATTDLECCNSLGTLASEDVNYTAFLDSFSKVLIKDPRDLLVHMLDKLEAIRLHALALEQWNAPHLKECHRRYRASATNLIHYVALQSMDVRQLKEALSALGLSNLEGINAHIMASLQSVIQILLNLTHLLSETEGESNFEDKVESPSIEITKISKSISNLQSSSPNLNGKPEEISLLAMKNHVRYNAESLFGPPAEGRKTHIMVTVGNEAADNENLIHDLIKAGVNVVRINCAHDDPDIWRFIIRNVRSSSQMLEQPCRVLMDLAGPKLRTGPFKPGPNVRKIKPIKDTTGVVIAPAQVWLGPPEVSPPAHRSHDCVLPVVDKHWIRNLEVGDVLKFDDARGKRRMLKIAEKFFTSSDVGCWAECYQTAFVESGTEFHVKGKKGKIGNGRVAELPAVQQYVRVKVGDLLVITREPCLAPSESINDSSGPAKVNCSFGRLFDSVKPGEPIEFDDGRIEGVIQGVNISEICVQITRASEKGSKLGPEKSINVPKSNLRFEGLTVKDLMDLDFVAANADMVGISFVNDVKDIVVLQQELEKRKLKNLGIVLKIETRGGFERLPLLLLQAMQAPNPLGVMIARGDLAVECGWERLAEMQEEILSICEAGHIAAIWATQVLENVAKSGLPTRAEITDAAVGGRAECVMLNKGRYISKAVSTLDSILRSTPMQQPKMEAILKPLLLSRSF